MFAAKSLTFQRVASTLPRMENTLSAMAIHAGLVVLSIVMLWKGADYFVESAAKIARRFGISELVIGLTLVALGTSAPEFAVSIGAALDGLDDISVSNIVGSNIFNLGIILGGTAMIRPLTTTRDVVVRDGAVLIGVAALVVGLLFDLTLSRFEGLMMLSLLGFYIFILFRESRAGRSEPDKEEGADGEQARPKDVLVCLLGLSFILWGSEILVESASAIARSVGMSEWVIGLTIVAAGTSTPEAVTSLMAAFRGRFGMSAGTLIGSDLYNILGVLGAASAIRPLTIDASAQPSLWLLLFGIVAVVVAMRTGWKVSRAEGGVLVSIARARWGFEIWGSSVI